MPAWSLTLLENPMNTPSGETGIVGALVAATLGQMPFALTDIDTITFTTPSRHYQTPLIVRFSSDVLLYRLGDEPGAVAEVVQRFRVLGRTVGFTTTTFSASSYREVLNARIFHDGDVLDYPPSLTGTAEQSAIAWSIIQAEQAKPSGDLGIHLGHVPTTDVERAAFVVDVSGNTTPQHFFTPGESVGQAIQAKLAGLDNGFEWDIEPDPAHPTTRLLFNAWNAGARGQESALVLSEATMDPSTTLAELASDYANVYRGEGGSSTVDGATLPGVIVWVPADENPVAEDVPTGRWEFSESSTDLQTTTEVTDWATRQAALRQEIQTWSVTLAPGVWLGPSQLWVGDTAKLNFEIQTTYDDGSPADKLLSVDASLRVLGVTVTVAPSGAETVSLSLNHPKTKFADGPIPPQLAARLARLERRS